jgi:hypothetical protein
MKKVYVLEVQRYVTGGNWEIAEMWNGLFEHVGYMDKVFLSKKAACEYYDGYNSHMRSLNAHHTWKSDWDPNDNYRYVVRSYSGECLTIPTFESREKPRQHPIEPASIHSDGIPT